MAKVKTVNYTPAQTASMVLAYIAGGKGMNPADFDARDVIVKQLASELKPDLTPENGVRSIRAKLTREKNEDGTQVYIARSTISGVTGKTPVKKDLMAQNCVDAAGNTGAVSNTPLNAASVEKMNKTEIDIFTMQFESLHDEIADLQNELEMYRGLHGDLPEPESENESENESQD